MPTFKRDDLVKLIQPTIQGVVKERSIIEDEDVYLVAWTDEAGEPQERRFHDHQLEAVVVEAPVV